MDNLKLIKSSKIIDRILKILQIIMIVVMILGALFFLILVVVSPMDDETVMMDAYSVTLGDMELQLADGFSLNGPTVWAEMLPELLYAIVMVGLGWYGLWVLRQIFAPMKEGRPFEQGISGQVRKLAWISLIGGALGEFGDAALQTYEMMQYDFSKIFNPDIITGYTYNADISLNFIILPVMLFLLAHVFRYGEALQKESDETL